MEFKILSHAGLLVKNKPGKSLICDPWLIGSSYWRSWWNYPPVSPALINSLCPNFIYLTHIHWALNLVFNAYEYDLLLVRKLFTGRSLESWLMRWREIVLYLQLAKDKLLFGKLDLEKYLR